MIKKKGYGIEYINHENIGFFFERLADLVKLMNMTIKKTDIESVIMEVKEDIGSPRYPKTYRLHMIVESGDIKADISLKRLKTAELDEAVQQLNASRIYELCEEVED